MRRVPYRRNLLFSSFLEIKFELLPTLIREPTEAVGVFANIDGVVWLLPPCLPSVFTDAMSDVSRALSLVFHIHTYALRR